MKTRRDILASAPDGATHYCPYLNKYYFPDTLPQTGTRVVNLDQLVWVEPDVLADAVLQYPSYAHYCEHVVQESRVSREVWEKAFGCIWVMTPANELDATLAERGSRYGDFAGHAEITQKIKDVMRTSKTSNWDKLTYSQKESLEMAAHKIGRILNGDPDYADSWHDVAGYVRLVEKQLTDKQE